jgi:hypothetical protein
MDLIGNYDSSNEEEPSIIKRVNLPAINLTPDVDITNL